MSVKNDCPVTYSARWIESLTASRTFNITLSSPCANVEEILNAVAAAAGSASFETSNLNLFVKSRGFPVVPINISETACGAALPTGMEVQRLIFSASSAVAGGTSFAAGTCSEPEALPAEGSLTQRLTRFYMKYNPPKIGDIPRLIQMYPDPVPLFLALVEKYGPE